MSSSKLQALSSGGDLFAYSEPTGILKFWDTVSGKLVHEFQPAEHICAQPTCLTFLERKKKGKSRVAGTFDIDLLAIGNVAGKVLIYSPKQQRLISTLVLNTGSSIVDVSWHTNSTLISLAKDKTLTSWNVATGKKISEHSVDGNNSLCILGGTDMVVAGYGLQLLKLHEDSVETMTSYIGKSQEVVQLLPLAIESVPIAKYFLSALKGSKLLYSWLAEPKDGKYLSRSLTCFNAEDTIMMVSCFQLKTHLAGIICTTKKGSLKYFTNYFNGQNIEPQAPKKVKSEVVIINEQTGKCLPILAAYFLSSEVILICYGYTIRPVFERINVKTLTEKLILNRVDPMFVEKKMERNNFRVVTPRIISSISCISSAYTNMSTGWGKRSIENDQRSSKYQKL